MKFSQRDAKVTRAQRPREEGFNTHSVTKVRGTLTPDDRVHLVRRDLHVRDAKVNVTSKGTIRKKVTH